MTVWAITHEHANLLASAYLDLVNPAADPQDMGMAFLADSLQGVQAAEGRKLPHDWERIEAYRFAKVPARTMVLEIDAAAALVSDTARAAPGWYETDTRRWLSELAKASNE